MRKHAKWTACVVLIAASILARFVLFHLTGVDTFLRPLLAAVIVAALLISPNAAMVVAVLGSIASYLLFPQQWGAPHILTTPALVDIMIFLVVAWGTSYLIGWDRQRRLSAVVGRQGSATLPADIAGLAGSVAHIVPIYAAMGHIETFRLSSIVEHDPIGEDMVLPRWREAVGQTLDVVIPNLKASGIFNRLCHVLSTGRPARFEVPLPADPPDPSLVYELRAARAHDLLLVSWRDLSQEREVQRRLRLNEWRYRCLTQATAAIVWSTPASGEFESDQPEWSAFTGQRYEEYKGWGWVKAIHAEDRDRVVLAWSTALAKRSLFQVDYRLRNREGDFRFMSVRAVPITGDNGEILEWLGVHSDVTDRRRAEQLVAESERHLRRVLNNLFAFVGVLTPDGTLISTNNAPVQAAGIRHEDVLGRKFWDCYWWSHSTAVREQVKQAVEKASRGESSRYDADVQVAGGRLVTIDFMIAPMRDENGRITHLIPSGVDISDRKSAEAKLVESEQFYRQLIEGLPQITWTCLPDGTCDFVSKRWFEYTGQAAGTNLSFTQPDYIHPDDHHSLMQAWQNAVRTGAPLHVELRVRRRDGDYRWFDVYAIPVYDASGQLVKWFGSSMDVEDRKQAEEALRRSEARLRTVNATLERRVRDRTAEVEARSDQLRALALDLAETESRERKRLAQILHDHFQQLVSAAKLKAGLLRRKAGNEEIVNALRQVEDLLNEAITASRSLATELSPPVLHDGGLIAALEWLARRMERDHAMRVEVSVGTECEPDNEQVRVILFECVRELLFNVRKHAGVDQAKLVVELLPEGLLCIRVMDQGKGFDPTREERRSKAEGTFGLFSIHERLSLIGGLMKVESRVGGGTSVDLTVPCVPSKQPAPETSAFRSPVEPVPAKAGQASRLRVLVADDHRLFREGLVTLLLQEPYVEVVGQAGDGEEAVALARTLRPDILIVDVSMPKMNGVQVTSLVSHELPQTRIIGLSMHEDEDMAQAMRSAGAIAYCPKSGAAEELLLKALRQVARSSEEQELASS